ncbi:protein-glutamate O-methyltransferase CheR [Methylophaga sp.]|uniref:CheR family methyltransferase n=1 Tax=Methylophaga sp. TaxID=2024840 RepID=UPI00272A8B92|nr:protein-glutamate O-methyltransferase [Methylophaga sp.]
MQSREPLQSRPAITNVLVLKDSEFNKIRDLIYDIAGISLAPVKKTLVSSRLSKHLRETSHHSFSDYFNFITSKGNESQLQYAVDLLTTNETYFFREIKHFDFLQKQILPSREHGRTFRVWSAACSTGEEPYSVAMLLDDLLGQSDWQVLATDISNRVLEKAKTGIYPMTRIKDLPERLLRAYCLKGVGKYDNSMMVTEQLRKKVQFQYLNLNKSLPQNIGLFDVIFLRNVMIYFDLDTKRQVVERMLPHLRPDGFFIVGHSETLGGVCDSLKAIAPSIYTRA